MNNIELKTPKTINDLRIHHNDILSDEKYNKPFVEGDKLYERLICEFVSEMTGVDLPTIMTVHIPDLIKIVAHCIGMFNDYKKSPPPEVITIEGVDYYKVNPSKVASGWHIDLASFPKNPPPTLLMALVYIPKGVYGQKDLNDNTKFPLAEREKLFKDHFKLTDFLDVVEVFAEEIREVNERIHGSPKNETDKKKKPNENRSRFEWEELVDLLSKEFNLSWYEVTQLNIYTFNHRVKFLLYKNQKNASKVKKVKR